MLSANNSPKAKPPSGDLCLSRNITRLSFSKSSSSICRTSAWCSLLWTSRRWDARRSWAGSPLAKITHRRKSYFIGRKCWKRKGRKFVNGTCCPQWIEALTTGIEKENPLPASKNKKKNHILLTVVINIIYYISIVKQSVKIYIIYLWNYRIWQVQLNKLSENNRILKSETHKGQSKMRN